MKLTEGVYAYEWKEGFVNNSNMFYFGEPLNILFDPGLTEYVKPRLKAMKNDGIDTDSIKYIVNTHCHPDHFEGTEFFIDKKTPIAMHKDEISFFNQMGPHFFKMFGMTFPSIDFDIVMEEGPWEVGGTELEVYHTPGHSPGSVCIYWKEKKALVCGDLIFNQSVGRVDFPGGNGEQMVESIKKISRLDVEILLPGHMDIITGADNVKKNFKMIEEYFFPMM